MVKRVNRQSVKQSASGRSFWRSIRKSVFAAALTWICVQLAAHHAGWVERWYSHGIYPTLASWLSAASRMVVFSLDDLFYVFLLLFGLIVIVLAVLRRMKFRTALRLVICTLCWTYVAFYWLWGMNYFREGLNQRLDIKHRLSSEKVLDDVTAAMIDHANHMQEHLDFLQRGTIDSLIESSYCHLASFLQISYPGGTRRAKTITFSRFFAQAGISGYYGPFFSEIHVNRQVLLIEYPFVLAHEKAHQFGITSEAEANFYAWMACRYSGDYALAYSADLGVLPYLFQEIRSPDKRIQLLARIHPAVRNDFRRISTHWRKLRNKKVDHYASKINDSYLKANHVQRGIRDYTGVVRFIIDFETDSTALRQVKMMTIKTN